MVSHYAYTIDPYIHIIKLYEYMDQYGSHYAYTIDPYIHTIKLYEYMDRYFQHYGIPLSAHFIYLNLASILA